MKFRDRPMTDSEIAILKIIDRSIRWHRNGRPTIPWRILRNRLGKRIGIIKSPVKLRAALATRVCVHYRGLSLS